MSIDREKTPKSVAWMQVDAQGHSSTTGELTPLRKTLKEALRKIPWKYRKNLPDHKRADLRRDLAAACRMMASRKMLSVLIDFHNGSGIHDAGGICFHVDPSLIPEADANGLVMRLTADGEYCSLYGFSHSPGEIEKMQKAFPRRGGNRE